MKHYVAGFYFDADYQKVALVLKNRPAWQRDSFNAIGGKIEPGESAHQAIDREFREETGVSDISWELFLKLLGKDWQVHFFRGCGDPTKCTTKEDEKIYVLSIEEALSKKVIPNLYWILPLALDKHVKAPISVGYYSETL